MVATKDVKLETLTLRGGWRNGLDSRVVGKIAEALSAGHEVPPIRITKDRRVVFGFHRIKAHQDLKRNSIRAEVAKFDSAEEERASAIMENLYRRELSTEERDAALLELTVLYVQEEEGGVLNGHRVHKVADTGKPAYRPKTAERKAVERVAEEIGRSVKTVDRAIDRAEAREAGGAGPDATPRLPTLPIDTRGRELPPAHANVVRAICEVYDGADKALRQVQGALTRLQSQLGDAPESFRSGVGPANAARLIHDAAVLLRQDRPASVCPYCKLAADWENCAGCKGTGVLTAHQMGADIPPELLVDGAEAGVFVGKKFRKLTEMP